MHEQSLLLLGKVFFALAAGIYVILDVESQCQQGCTACSSTLPSVILRLLFTMCCRLSDKNPINADDELLELLS